MTFFIITLYSTKMKNCSIIFSMAILLLASCVNTPQEDKGAVQKFNARSESATKTKLEGLKVVWESDDYISVFSATCPNGEIFSIDPEGAGSQEAAFTGASVGEGPWYALFPSDGASVLSGKNLSVFLPSVQQYADGGFGSNDNPMVAVSSSSALSFKNLCGALVLKLRGRGTVKTIRLTSNLEECLWGPASVDMDYEDSPELKMEGAYEPAMGTLTLDCGAGIELCDEDRQFFFMLPPGTLSQGFTVEVSDGEGNEFVKQSSTPLTTERSGIKRMASLDCSLSGSDWTDVELFGVYDLSGAEAVPIRVLGSGDQLALRLGQGNSFRIQNLTDANAVIINYPAVMSEGGSYTIEIESIGRTGLVSGTAGTILVKAESGKYWLEDTDKQVGYLIAGEL